MRSLEQQNRRIGRREFRVVLDDFAGGPLGELRLVEGCCLARKRQFHKHGLPLERER